jgi:hypothetical protein
MMIPAATTATEAITIPAIPPDERVVVVVVVSSDPPPMALSVVLGAMDGRFVNDGEEDTRVGSPDEEVGGTTLPLDGVGAGEMFGAFEAAGESVLSI